MLWLVEYLPEHCENAEKQMDILTGLQQEAEQAQRYMQHLPSEDLHKLSEPDSWAGVPWLSYSEKMCRLFGYKPLHIFRKNLQKELRGINFLTTCRKVYRWRNCPAGKEILATAE